MRSAVRGSISSIRNKAVDRMRERAEGLGEQYLWNWNNVESTLLMCAVLVNVFGIMFASEYVEAGDYTYESLGSITLTVIVFSLTYYLTVVWSEVVVKLAPGLTRWCSACIRWFSRSPPLADGADDVDGDFIPDSDIVFSDVSANPMARGMNRSGWDAAPDDMMPNPMRQSTTFLTVEQQVELSHTVEKQQMEINELKRQIATGPSGGRATSKPSIKKKKRILQRGKGGRRGGTEESTKNVLGDVEMSSPAATGANDDINDAINDDSL